MNKKNIFYNYLQESEKEIDAFLLHYMEGYWQSIEEKSSSLLPLYNTFQESINGGKMLRGTFVKLGFSLVEKRFTKNILNASAAFELLHTSFLIHDDIIDKSPLRRGKDALHMALGGDHYGMSQAICFGDLGFFLAFKLINESSFPNKRKNNVSSIFSDIALNTVLGEMLDVKFAKDTGTVTEEDIITMNNLKSAQYTFVGPLTVGAILGGANQELINNLTIFGEKLGIAFQLQDDLLGIFGNDKNIGKSINSDIEEGKQTVMLAYCLRNATEYQKKYINIHYGQGSIAKAKQQKLLEIFENTGARNYMERLVIKYSNDAKKYISSLTNDKSKQQLLDSCIELLVRRTY